MNRNNDTHSAAQAAGSPPLVEPHCLPADDTAIFKFLKEKLYVAAVCDILDTLGYRRQAMHARLRPLLPDIHHCGFAGRARTLHWVQTDALADDDPYGLEIEAMDALRPGDVVVHSTAPSDDIVPWGELMTTVAVHRGAVGCVCDAMVRDCTRIIALGFPVFSAGIRPLDSKGRGKVTAYDEPIHCGDVRVQAGEIVFADYDGIVVIPREVESSFFQQAFDKVERENKARSELRAGKSLREVYDKYGTL